MYFIFENLNQSAIIILKFHSRENKIINSVIKTVLLRGGGFTTEILENTISR